MNSVGGLIDSAGKQTPSTPNSPRTPSAVAIGGSPGGDVILRRTAGRKAAVVLDIVKGKTTPADVACHDQIGIRHENLPRDFRRWGLVPHSALAASNGPSSAAMISAAAFWMRLSDTASVSALPS